MYKLVFKYDNKTNDLLEINIEKLDREPLPEERDCYPTLEEAERMRTEAYAYDHWARQ